AGAPPPPCFGWAPSGPCWAAWCPADSPPRNAHDPADGLEVNEKMANVSVRPTVNIAPASLNHSARSGGQPPSGPAPKVLELTDVSVFYGNYEAVRGTTMSIGRNQITAMIGPSGCGKSTILRT